jgi:hypothetical protein
VSAVLGNDMSDSPETRATLDRKPQDAADENDSEATFWHWFALAALLFAWIAEATMCAERGF